MKIIITTGKKYIRKIPVILFLSLFILFQMCNDAKTDDGSDTIPKAIVKIGTFRSGEMSEEITLQAQSAYLIKSSVNAPISCYILKTFVNRGDRVKEGQLLFEIITKEAKAAELSSVLKDSTMQSIGRMEIRSGFSGIMTEVYKYPGDYAGEDAELCQISDYNSLAFILQVPLEFSDDVKSLNVCQVRLADGKEFRGRVEKELDKMNLNGQTRQYIIRISSNSFIPEDMLASVRITTMTVSSDQILPPSALLADEMMHKFWVMKMINDSMAVKVYVKPGLRSKDEVEIKEPLFNKTDRILITGNYGLPDTAYVQIEK